MDIKLPPEIMNELLVELENMKTHDHLVPIGISARHCHLTEEDFKILFGNSEELTKKKDLFQPGQFAANETILISGPKGSIEKVRILGPFRSKTQVEISLTDAIRMGVRPPIRQSGNIKGSSPVTLVGPSGSIFKEEGLIIAQAHVHMSPSDAALFRVKDGELVSVEAGHGIRKACFSNVMVRINDKYRLEMHIDTDEANACSIENGHFGKIVKRKDEGS
ncbi:hypothetical protein AC623_07185 [Bacillus sp. FJAT-27231]|uniref:phosphate propanoyltransferase n=1 Tax=Bacillus sp. FJAT-27231 TaxID=1679168 RepID=UPI00067103DA|nr:phosphate propanoyltransferase [Bacillus sp. FJAT-27231]KMY53782.1 hypothetical protein AC623_07185 [Bacillus sp. FJAT-27231]